MTGQKGIPIVGGPMNGQWWPAEGSPPRCEKTVPVIPSFSETDVVSETVYTDVVNYVRRTMRQPLGQVPTEIEIYAPSDWTTDQIVEYLNRYLPNGIA